MSAVNPTWTTVGTAVDLGQPRSGRRRGSVALLLIVSILWLALLLLFSPEMSRLTLAHASLVTVISAACLGLLIYRADPRGTSAFPFLYFLVLSVFHGGLYLASALPGEAAAPLSRLELLWFARGPSVRAAHLVNVGLVCYAGGYALSRWVAGQRTTDLAPSDDHASVFHDRSRGIVAVGCAVTLLSTLAWYVVSIARAGFGFFLGSYLGYLRETNGSVLPWAYVGISIGVALCALGTRTRLGRIGLAAFAGFAVPAFLLGLRGEVLFPLVAVIGVLGCQRRLWRDRNFWLACVVVLVGISFVSQARVEGLGAVGRSNLAVSPIRAVAEMGHSVRPVSTSVNWHENGAEPFLDGATYTAPIDRQARALLGLPVVDAQNDHRLMNVEIGSRVGAIGGSVIAEAHHNGGPGGVAVVMTLLGLISGCLFRNPRSAVSMAFSGLVAVLLLMHIRNSFAPIPAWAALGCVLIGIGFIATKIPMRPSGSAGATRKARR